MGRAEGDMPGDRSRGGEPAQETERPLRDQEPLATVRTFPRRFAVGLPLVILVPIAVALPFAEDSLARAVALQLFLQTAGLLWLYIPAYRRRYMEEAARLARILEERGREASGDPGES